MHISQLIAAIVSSARGKEKNKIGNVTSVEQETTDNLGCRGLYMPAPALTL